MDNLPGIVVTGASGRMGRMLAGMIAASEKARLVGCLERPGHAWIGRDIGECLGGAEMGVLVSDDPLAVFAHAQAVIDFTAPAASVEFAALAAQARAVHVIGTTGLEPEHHRKIDLAAHHAVIIQAGNMSLGVNLMLHLIEQASAALDEHFDIEINETHHRHKKDSPSGTALAMGKAAAKGRNQNFETVKHLHWVTPITRKKGDIGFSVQRGGEVIGDHKISFFGDDEIVELAHRGQNRMIYAKGAVRAALWLVKQNPGLYSMRDVLGL